MCIKTIDLSNLFFSNQKIAQIRILKQFWIKWDHLHRQSGAPFFTKFIWPEAINPEILEEAPGTIVLKRSRECRVVKKDPKLLWGRGTGGCLQKSWILNNELQFRPLSSCLRGALGVVNLFWCSLDNMISR